MTPIVLHHGLFGHGQLRWGPLSWSYFKGIDHAIAARGYQVILPGVHPTAAITTRARQLKEAIMGRLAKLNGSGGKMLILAHSLGGLDARYMITHLGMAEHVAALVTISTPHRGSPYADWCMHHIGMRMGALRLMKMLNLDFGAVADVTKLRSEAFNVDTPDDPGVRYYSISAQRPEKLMPPFARHSHRVIEAAEGPNDGLVSVASAQWGTHLTTWSADHWLTINRRLIPHAADGRRIINHWLGVLDRLVEDGVLEPAADQPVTNGTRISQSRSPLT